MDRRVTPPKRVTSPTWVPPPPYKQALRLQTVRILRIQYARAVKRKVWKEAEKQRARLGRDAKNAHTSYGRVRLASRASLA